jgi:class 3 adenylate cyclase
MVSGVMILVPLFTYFLERLSIERARSEALLLNVLPAEVATELKQTGETQARLCEAISVLFADAVNFTPLSAQMEPRAVVGILDDVFTEFDVLADKYGCEKIRTIGDAYMVAAGVIGRKKFQYDVWGDTVNTASRMESQGEPDRIQISEATYELIKDGFECVSRGPVEVKGKGVLNTWYLEGSREPALV